MPTNKPVLLVVVCLTLQTNVKYCFIESQLLFFVRPMSIEAGNEFMSPLHHMNAMFLFESFIWSMPCFFVKRNKKKLVYFFFIFPAVCVHMENYFPAAIKTTFVANIFSFLYRAVLLLFAIWNCIGFADVCLCVLFQLPALLLNTTDNHSASHPASHASKKLLNRCRHLGWEREVEGQVRPPIICLSVHRLSDCCLCCSQQQQQPSVIHHIRCKLLCGGIVLRMKCLSVVCCCCWSF